MRRGTLHTTIPGPTSDDILSPVACGSTFPIQNLAAAAAAATAAATAAMMMTTMTTTT